MSRAAIAILSTENLLHNLNIIQKAVPQSQIIAMIKANAYGHGLRSVAKRLEKKVYSLGVASIDEALALRKIDIKSSITLMEGAFEPDELLIASSQRFDVVIHDQIHLKWLESSKLPLPLKVWLKVDTGMGRLGFNLSDAQAIYEKLSKNPQIIQPIGIMSHFACADDANHPMNQKQIQDFKNLSQKMPGPKSLSNSAAIFSLPTSHFEIVRPGLALYGVSPVNGKSAQDLQLKPVMTLQTRLIAVRNAPKGASIGYGSQFVCPENMPIGVIAIGYGDGYPRSAKNGTPVLVNNIHCQIVGRVSMDMITIDLRACPEAKIGDPVILWGNGLPIEDVAPHTAHIPYDLLCAIQPRVKFHWTLF